MKNRILVLVAGLSLFLAACSKVNGTGPVVRQTVNAANFQKLTLEVPATLYYTPSTSFKVELEAQQNILNVLKTEVYSNTVFLTVRNNTDIRTREAINIYVEAPDLKQLQMTGNAKIVVTKPFGPDQLYLGITGSGAIDIPSLQTNRLVAEINGSGTIGINNGVALKADIDISGSGFANWENLTTDSVSSRINGSGVIRVFANEYINAAIAGSGSLFYKGNPVIESRVSGTGKIVKL